MSQFDKLMEELSGLQADQETMTKALPADDGKDEEKIQAAAAEGGSDHKEPDGDEGAGAGSGDGDGDEGGKPMAKSFKFTLEDGTEVEAQDGTELVKSLTQRVEASESTMVKALETAVGLIKGQGELIKSMQDQIKKLSGEGRGRKTVVSVVEKPSATTHTETMAKSMGGADGGVSPDEFFAKALNAQKEGRISGTEIALAETMLNRGQAIPQSIVARVMQ